MRPIALLMLTIAILLPAQPVWAQATERTVYASVVDKNDAPVTGLSVGDFIVREDDAAREVLRVSAATEPMQIAVLVDTSAGNGRASARRAQRAPWVLQADGRQGTR